MALCKVFHWAIDCAKSEELTRFYQHGSVHLVIAIKSFFIISSYPVWMHYKAFSAMLLN